MKKELKEITKIVKTTRENMHLSQNQFAKLLDTTQARISFIEGGHRGCSAIFLLKVLKLNPEFKVENIL